MSKACLAWSQGMAVSGRRSVPGQRLPLVAARLHPLQDSIRRLCGTKDISSLFFLCVMVSTWRHPRKECALTTTGLQAICIAQVRAIFKLLDHLGHYPHPLAYVEWFTSLRCREPISGQFLITHSTRNHQCNVSVISINRFARPCHLQAQCGKHISSDWSSNNILETASAFHVNSYIDLDTFVALCD